MYDTNIENENKINQLLNLIHDINKIVEENENKINSYLQQKLPFFQGVSIINFLANSR